MCSRTYGYVTYWIYLGYLAVPFLWELEVLLNWVCTETTLTLDYWVKYSDIKAYLFKLKCWQVTYESAYYLGEKQPAYMKYGIGGMFVLIVLVKQDGKVKDRSTSRELCILNVMYLRVRLLTLSRQVC